jgi:aldose 1-epimerase
MTVIIAFSPSLALQTQTSTSSPQESPTSSDAFQKYAISADGINATFIPYGARLTSLFVNDKNGRPQDVVLGYDDVTKYARDSETVHTYFGAVVGRYANR